jgi:signal transduction histidine kinase
MIQSERLLLLGELFPFLAHEIRNPLHAIGGALTIIQKRTKADPLIEQSINVIHDEIKRLSNFVKECLEFSNPSDPSKFVITDINDVIISSLDLMTPVFKDLSKDINLSLSLQEDLRQIKTNFNEIKQVFLNIIKNSVEAIDNEGEIIVKTYSKKQKSEKFITIEFSDNGNGIKEEILKKIFDPFFTTKTGAGGTGLGLAVCKKIICDNHQGIIDIKSNKDEGTTVTIKLPVGDPGLSEC